MIRRVGILGDVHGEHTRLAVALEWFASQAVDAIICTGDIADGSGCINLCCELLQAADVQTVSGNHDRWLLEDRVRHVDNAHRRHALTDASLEFLTGLPKQRLLDTTAGPLLLCHGVADNDLGKVWPGTSRTAAKRSPELDRLLADGHCSFVVNGHMHFRVLVDFEAALLINGGTITGSYAGVTVVDFDAGSICSYDLHRDRDLHLVAEHSLAADERKVWADTQAFDGNWQPAVLHRA